MSCTKGAQSLVDSIAYRLANVLFASSSLSYPNPITTTFCTGSRSVSYGTDNVVITSQCTSTTSGTFNTLVLRDAANGTILDIRFHSVGISVQSGWTLYAYVRLRWA